MIIPKANQKDLELIDQTVRASLNFVLAQDVSTVLETALNNTPEIVPTILRDIPDEVKSKSRGTTIRQ